MSVDRAEVLIALHRGPGFVIPNAWDAGSARLLEQAGFDAIATTSAGVAWSLGIADGGPIGVSRMLERVHEIADAVSVPVSADLESGYGDTAEHVRRTVGAAVDAGAVGGNLEDAVSGALLGREEAADRIAAARSAAPAGSFVLNARTDAYFVGGVDDPFAETIERAALYLAAGADCVFVPGITGADTIGRLAADIPAPVNVVAGLTMDRIPIPTLFELGVRRVSLGGSIARAAYSAVIDAALELKGPGTLAFLDHAASYTDLQTRFHT